jgi:FixJ family two-component response regulator
LKATQRSKTNNAQVAELIVAAEIEAAEKDAPLVVCLLDDDPSVLSATRRLLLSAGWEVESFTDPMIFLQYAHAYRPKVAVIDIRMPAMDGLEVQKHLRNRSPSTRVIVLTGQDDPKVRDEVMKRGADGFFIKPVDDEEFLARIECAFSRN